jgi:hypothetical protein
VWDAGSFAVDPHTEAAVYSSLNLNGVQPGQIVFFDSPMQIANETEPNQSLGG